MGKDGPTERPTENLELFSWALVAIKKNNRVMNSKFFFTCFCFLAVAFLLAAQFIPAFSGIQPMLRGTLPGAYLCGIIPCFLTNFLEVKTQCATVYRHPFLTPFFPAFPGIICQLQHYAGSGHDGTCYGG